MSDAELARQRRVEMRGAPGCTFPHILAIGGWVYALDASKTVRNASRGLQDSKTAQYASKLLPRCPKMPALPKTPPICL
eukprot:1901920-Pyramimonas_sp.AAC.1